MEDKSILTVSKAPEPMRHLSFKILKVAHPVPVKIGMPDNELGVLDLTAVE